MEPALVAMSLGAVVGLILALSGAGGGILAVPLLVFGLHLTIAQAAPVGLIAVGVSSAVGAVLGLRAGLVRYRAAALIGLVGMALAPLGLLVAQHVPNVPLTITFSMVLAFVAVRTLRQSRASGSGDLPLARKPCMLDPADDRLVWTAPCAWALGGMGAASES